MSANDRKGLAMQRLNRSTLETACALHRHFETGKLDELQGAMFLHAMVSTALGSLLSNYRGELEQAHDCAREMYDTAHSLHAQQRLRAQQAEAECDAWKRRAAAAEARVAVLEGLAAKWRRESSDAPLSDYVTGSHDARRACARDIDKALAAAVPQPPREWEVCGESDGMVECQLERGHEGDHACPSDDLTNVRVWKPVSTVQADPQLVKDAWELLAAAKVVVGVDAADGDCICALLQAVLLAMRPAIIDALVDQIAAESLPS